MRALVFAVGLTMTSGCLAPEIRQTQPSARQIDPTISSKSCNELAVMDVNLSQQMDALSRQERQKSRQQAVSNAAVNVGLGALLGASASGGIDAIRAAGATSSVVNSARSASQGADSFNSVQNATALASVRSQVIQTQHTKGCV